MLGSLLVDVRLALYVAVWLVQVSSEMGETGERGGWRMRGTYVVRGLVHLGAYGVFGGGGTVAEGGVGVFGDLCFARTR